MHAHLLIDHRSVSIFSHDKFSRLVLSSFKQRNFPDLLYHPRLNPIVRAKNFTAFILIECWSETKGSCK